MILGFIMGCITVISIIFNARMAERIGTIGSVMVNCFVATVASTAILIVSHIGFPNQLQLAQVPVWGYFGGVIGVFVMITLNVIIPRLPVVYSTIIVFLGQCIAGVVIDYLFGNGLSKGKFYGGVLIACGLFYNNYIDKKQKYLTNIVD